MQPACCSSSRPAAQPFCLQAAGSLAGQPNHRSLVISTVPSLAALCPHLCAPSGPAATSEHSLSSTPGSQLPVVLTAPWPPLSPFSLTTRLSVCGRDRRAAPQPASQPAQPSQPWAFSRAASTSGRGASAAGRRRRRPTRRLTAGAPSGQETVGSPTPEGIVELWSTLPCGHRFGSYCIKTWLGLTEQPSCPVCRREMAHACGHRCCPWSAPSGCARRPSAAGPGSTRPATTARARAGRTRAAASSAAPPSAPSSSSSPAASATRLDPHVLGGLAPEPQPRVRPVVGCPGAAHRAGHHGAAAGLDLLAAARPTRPSCPESCGTRKGPAITHTLHRASLAPASAARHRTLH